MDRNGRKRRQWASDTFTGTVIKVLRIIITAFIIINYIIVALIWGAIDNNTGIMLFFGVSIAHILLTSFLEPVTYGKYPVMNFIANIMTAACCGLLFFTHRTYMGMAIFFINMVIVGLRLSIIKSIVLAIVYYGVYIVSMIYGPGTGVETMLLDVQILILFLSTVYVFHYFSIIEKQKNQQDDAIAELLSEKVSLAGMLESKNAELEQTYWDMVETLIGVIEAKDNFTGGHSVKVCEYSVKLAKELEFDDDEMTVIMKASILHDIGKMGIPDNILLKPGMLSDDEYCTITTHPEIGYRILSKVRGLEDILPMVLHHHEKIDGTGYPYGLKGNKIPIGARIIAVADAYDAMTSNRPYRKALVKKEAKKRLLAGSGTQFDTHLVEKFMDIINNDNIDNINSYRYIDYIRKNAGIM